jgi:hypothetical protein
MRVSSYGIAVLFALAGCGGGSSVTLEQLPAAYAGALCDQNFKCASAADIMGRTKQDCLDTNTGILQLIVPAMRDSVSKGRSTYDAEKAGACITALRNLSCDDWVKGTVEPPACEGVTAPKVAIGGACGGDGDCVGGYCDGADTTTTPPTDGTCKATVAIGAACTATDTCADDGVCDATTKTCKAVVKKEGGQPCTSDTECSNTCNMDTMKCSGYAGCAVGGVTPRDTLRSLLILLTLAAVVGLARRRRSPQR